jgi:hypothetical protein
VSGHWRYCVAAFLLFGGLSTSPASSNPLTDLFNFAPKEAAAPTAAQENCVLQPGKSTAPGQHWVYRRDGHRKCWFQADQATVSGKKQIRHQAAKRPAIAPEEEEVALGKTTVLDAQAQLLSAAPAGAPPPAASAPEGLDTASVPAHGAATLVPASPIAAKPTIDQITPEHATPRSVDVEMLLAASTLDNDAAASSEPVAPPVVGADDWELMAARAGMVLIALGFVLVGSLLANRFLLSESSAESSGVRVSRQSHA